MRSLSSVRRVEVRSVLAGLMPVLFLAGTTAFAVPIQNDPNGFEGIPWRAEFSESADFKLVDNGPRIKAWELTQGPPPLGGATVDTMRFFTLNGQFARVMIRYHSPETHTRIANYFQTMYGPLDRTPGQISKGAVQQFHWRGDETLITMTYESSMDRGIIFFESRALALQFSESQMAPEPDLGGATY